jgi:hypothetical protein
MMVMVGLYATAALQPDSTQLRHRSSMDMAGKEHFKQLTFWT